MTGSFVWILLAVAAYGVLHSLLASLWLKARARHWLGPAGERFYRLFFNAAGVLTLLPVLALVRWLPDRPLYRIEFPWLLLALTGEIIAVGLLAAGVWQTGAWAFVGLEQAVGQAPPGPLRLVTGGLYRWVRHPLYSAGFLFMLSAPLMTANLLALYLGFAAYLVVGAILEERKLLAEFGPAYAEYRRQTPMFVPFLKPSPRRRKEHEDIQG